MRVTYGNGEKPRYEALRHAIDTYYQDLLRPLLKLRAAVFGVLPLRDPQRKDAEDEEGVEFTDAQLALVDRAVAIFLDEMAGTNRTREGFVAAGTDVDQPNGIIQGRDLFCYSLGISRGAELLNASPTLHVAGRSPAVEKLLNDAFSRLSENGALRLEGVKDEIHGLLVSAQEAGLSPIETGRQLARQFDEYEGWEFQRLARTEAAFASEAGVRDQLKDLDIQKVEILVSSGACDECVGYEGMIVDIDDEDQQPPFHPNCLCSVAPVTEDADGAEEEGESPTE